MVGISRKDLVNSSFRVGCNPGPESSAFVSCFLDSSLVRRLWIPIGVLTKVPPEGLAESSAAGMRKRLIRGSLIHR